MLYNFHESLRDMYDLPIEITVSNSQKLRSDSLIGSFKLDMGSVYDQPGMFTVCVTQTITQNIGTNLGFPLM